MKSLFRWKRLVVSIVTVFSLMIGVAEAAYAENMETYVEETSFDENDVYEDMVTYSKLDTIENTWQGSNIHILKGQKYRFGQVGIFIWNGWNRCITMDSNRNLIALEIGTSSLRLACNGEVGLYTVNVVASGKTVVDVENKTITIAKGKKMSIPGQFKYTIEAASDAEGKEITEKKNFKKIAALNSGTLTAKGAGSVEVKMTGLINTAYQIKIDAPTFDASAKKINVGESIPVSIENTTIPANWESSNPEVISISEEGVVHAYSAGSSTITCTINGKVFKKKITAIAQKEKPSAETVFLNIDGKASSKVVKIKGVKSSAIKWETDDPTIVSVKNGCITSEGKVGKATVTATVDDAVYPVNVYVYNVSMANDGKTLVLCVIDTGLAEIDFGDENTLEKHPQIVWKSSKPSIARMSGDAIWPVSAGETKITTSVLGKKFTMNVKTSFDEYSTITCHTHDWKTTSETMKYCPICGTWEESIPTTKYTIEFETNGGSSISSIEVEKGDSASDKMPENPTKEGFLFAGWYTDRDLTQAFDVDTKIYENITLYASWTPVNETLNDSSNGDVDALEEASLSDPDNEYMTEEATLESELNRTISSDESREDDGEVQANIEQ